MSKIIRNSIKCNRCGEIITSTRTHEFVTCKCGCCSVDGGLDYLKRSCNCLDDFTELSQFEEEAKALPDAACSSGRQTK